MSFALKAAKASKLIKQEVRHGIQYLTTKASEVLDESRRGLRPIKQSVRQCKRAFVRLRWKDARDYLEPDWIECLESNFGSENATWAVKNGDCAFHFAFS